MFASFLAFLLGLLLVPSAFAFAWHRRRSRKAYMKVERDVREVDKQLLASWVSGVYRVGQVRALFLATQGTQGAGRICHASALRGSAADTSATVGSVVTLSVACELTRRSYTRSTPVLL